MAQFIERWLGGRCCDSNFLSVGFGIGFQPGESIVRVSVIDTLVKALLSYHSPGSTQLNEREAVRI